MQRRAVFPTNELDGPLLTTWEPEQKVRAGHLPEENTKQRQGPNCPPAGRQDLRSEQERRERKTMVSWGWFPPLLLGTRGRGGRGGGGETATLQ